MGSIMDKLRNMEEDEYSQQVKKPPVTDRFMQLYAAALTGVIAHQDSANHDDKELVLQAYNLANQAYQKVKQ